MGELCYEYQQCLDMLMPHVLDIMCDSANEESEMGGGSDEMRRDAGDSGEHLLPSGSRLLGGGISHDSKGPRMSM